ncbi:uncharacterized protein BDR25DRAFT_309120 [Lindgomyces ingoldianus]|uniref:Uncharacterized protein n=1 Tax=Lindgomyces ingoldianus TaxID=673940 RepID=A0ACB6RJ35_9PLEO|nr:uncharacterized protein BDR25DRAFT_309120 [Lindgomyces ingoldianus]KAF2478355.1 hypothetical protein BDR25DRAFT_309120 [Lindgomyces ingoldianus]
MSTFKQSTACCTVPPIDPKEVTYSPKGNYQNVGGLRTCILPFSFSARVSQVTLQVCHANDFYYHTDITGDDFSHPPTHALVVLYDIFAFHSNTLRGADILATSGDRSYLVLMPDFFEGKVADWDWYPDDTPEKTEKLEGFLSGPGNTEKTVEKVMMVQKEASEKWKGVQKWGVLGYCWGGWVVSYCSGPSTPFSAVAQLHPGFVGKNIAEKIIIPVLAIASKDEPEERVKRFMNELNPNISYKNYAIFPKMEHGWLSARGDLEKEEVKEAYEEGYKMMLDFFGEWM